MYNYKDNNRGSYRYYRDESNNPVDRGTYAKIFNGFMKYIVKRVIEGCKVGFPKQLGYLSVVGKKQKVILTDWGETRGLHPNWAATNKLWEENEEARNSKKIVYHLNTHTDGVRFKFKWSKSRIRRENKNYYFLKMSRTNKRMLYETIMEGNTNYPVMNK